MRRALLGLVLLGHLVLAGACVSSEVTRVALPEADDDYFFFVALDPSLVPLRVSPVYGVKNGALTFGGSPIFALDEGGSSAVIVGLRGAALGALHAGVDLGREREIAVRLEAPPPALVTRGAAPAALVDVALAEGTAIADASGRGLDAATKARALAALRTHLTLTLPVDLEYCGKEAPLELRPFGDTALLLQNFRLLPGEPASPPTVEEPGYWRQIRRIAILDADTVVASTVRSVFIVRRGQPIHLPRTVEEIDPTVASDYLPFSRAVTGTVGFEATALDRSGLPFAGSRPGERLLLAAGGIDGHPAVLELAVSSAGVRFLRRAELDPGIAARNDELADVSIDGDGNAIVSGKGNTLAVRGARETSFRPGLGLDGHALFAFRRAVGTRDIARPFLVAEDGGRLYIGDPRVAMWTEWSRSDRLFDRRFYDLYVAPGGIDYWAAGPRGGLFRYTGGPTWTQITPTPPSNELGCSGVLGPDGQPTFQKDIHSVVADARWVYLLVSDCPSLIRLQRSDLCPALLPIADGGAVDLRTLDLLDGRLVAGGASGAVFDTVVR